MNSGGVSPQSPLPKGHGPSGLLFGGNDIRFWVGLVRFGESREKGYERERVESSAIATSYSETGAINAHPKAIGASMAACYGLA